MNNAEKPKPMPLNTLAQNLLDRLDELGATYHAGHFGTDQYCVGVMVLNAAEAAKLGMELGTGWGEIGFDSRPHSRYQYVVFRDARVQAGI